MKVLLTGANGTFGQAFRSAYYPFIDLIPLSHAQLDITDAAQVEECVRTYRPVYLVNAAAYTDVNKCQTDSVGAYRLNATAPRYLVDECERTGTTLIHLSTDYVFDGTKTAPYTEDDSVHPLNVYGASKRAGEEIVLQFERGIVVRTSWVYSVGARNFLSNIPVLLHDRAESGQPLIVESLQQNAPTYAPHLVEMLVRLMHEGITSGLFHGCNTGFCTRYSLADAMRTQLLAHHWASAPVMPLQQEGDNTGLQGAPRPLFSAMSNERLASTLGIPLPTWQEAVWEFVNTFTTK